MRTRFLSAVVILAVAVALSGCESQPVVEMTEPLSFDGLTPLQGTIMTRVWVREGFSLDGYRKVILEGAGIQYRPVPRQPTTGPGNGASEFPLTRQQKQELELLITQEFDRALDRLELTEVSEPGPDVLRVRGFMLDVVSSLPPDTTDRIDYHLDSIGQATFVVELIDSESNSVLVRALDTRAAALPGTTRRAGAAATQAEVRLLVARWADMLVDALNDLTAIDELKGA
jgi:hypothetical protein